ncbi:FKBP-type peptidyl-prolyl cis-trans isomerase [Methanolobus profundi]|uniref:Peptidyl-prolyl cis-trans isomerase n=1 Tax=Methanolobus profundi TaxID=487685 RepID=A0A1I4PB69_9EURY|nr:peptidylprolyl isomerase [Methanolobus profundi]SFM24787.1 FKBP-type peptidyl-prolyl cis-trans isomerase SlyD [Methanolobus profundi]
MAIEKGDFIKINYTGKFNEGQIFDTTDEQLAKDNGIYNPRGVYGGDVVIVGSGHTIKGLDEDFVGKDVGYNGTVTIAPEMAFGPHNPALVQTVSVTKLKEQLGDQRPYPGMPVELDGRRGVISQVIGRRIRVDLNHALAGKEVEYEYTIVEKIEDKVAKAQGLLSLYTGMPEIEIEVTDDLIRIYTPIELGFNQRWLVSKLTIAGELIDKLGVPNLEYVEKHPYVPETAEVPEATEAPAEDEEAEATEE